MSRWSSQWKPVGAEIGAQINAADVFVLHNLVRCATHQHTTIVQNIGSVDDLQGFLNVVIGDQNADAAVFEISEIGRASCRERVFRAV